MYKIRPYLLFLMLAAHQGAFGQKPPTINLRIDGADTPAPVHLTNEVPTDRKTAFIAHLLADQVEPGRKYAYDVRVMGRTVSLPYPTPCQTQPLWQ